MAGTIVAIAGSVFRHQVYVDRAAPQRRTDVVIARGATFHEVTAQLTREGVIAHPLAFRLLARLRGVENGVRAGEFAFPPHQSTDEILRTLISGSGQVAVWVTVPEGFTAREVAERLGRRGLGSAAEFERTFATESADVLGSRTHGLEGFLFPSTYLMPTPVTPQVAAKVMLEQFRKELPPDARQRAKRLGYHVPEIVTIASLIEREAKSDDERALMAGVYYNRLRIGMPLEVDATIEYALPSHKSELSRADLRIDSPYNTYKHAGLPPTPIANPGGPSLRAAFNPTPSQFLYYVYKGNGHHAFAKTLREHNANVARYLR